MSRPRALAFGLTLLAVAGCRPGDAEVICGTWLVVSTEYQGVVEEILPGPDLQTQHRLVITSDEIRFLGPGAATGDASGYRLHPGRSPKAIDLLRRRGDEELVVEAIYELKNDTLRLAIPLGKASPRPSTFTTGPDSDSCVIVLRRFESAVE
jgi:uncharacterized protein (TIGR03067 family)